MKFEHFFVQTLYSKIDISRKKMDQLVGFLLHPPLSEIGKKIGKMLKYTPHFQSAFGTAGSNFSKQHISNIVFRFTSIKSHWRMLCPNHKPPK